MATLFQKPNSPNWYVQYWDSKLQTQRKKSLRTADLAKAEAAKKVIEIRLETGVDITQRHKPKITFSQIAVPYIDWYEGAYPANYPRTKQIVEQYLIPFFGEMPAGDVDGETVAKFKKWRRNPAAMKLIKCKKMPKDATLQKEVRVIHALYEYAVATSRLDTNPVNAKAQKRLYKVAVNDSKPVRFFMPDELDRIYEADPDYACYYRFLANTGLRQAEMSNLRWTDIVGDNHINILSSAEQRTKSGKWRKVDLSEGAKEALIVMRFKRGREHFVFPQMRKESWWRRFKRAIVRAGIADGTFHDLRHTFCSHLAMAGVAMQSIQVLAGHAKIETTMGYAHLHPDHLAGVVERLKL